MEEKKKQLKKARQHMSAVAAGLMTVLGPIDAAGTMIGAAVGVLETNVGKEKTIEYLIAVASDLEHEPPTPPTATHNSSAN